RGCRRERLPDDRFEELPRLARQPPASDARAPLRPRRGAAADTRRGGRPLQREPRACPSDRSPVAEEARSAGRGSGPARGRVRRFMRPVPTLPAVSAAGESETAFAVRRGVVQLRPGELSQVCPPAWLRSGAPLGGAPPC